MKLRPIASALLASLLLAGLAACGGGKTSQTQAAATMAAGPMSAATTEAQREAAALPQSAAVSVPAALDCGAVKPVWVNLRSKAYHVSPRRSALPAPRRRVQAVPHRVLRYGTQAGHNARCTQCPRS